MLLGGLDVGTTGCKITVYDELGSCVCRAYQDYPVFRGAGEHEVAAEAIWEGVKTVLKAAAQTCRSQGAGLTALGVTSFGESCVLLDEEDRPVQPIMLYTDSRGEEECRELSERLGKETMQRISGVSPHSMYSLPKVMWVKKHRPREYGRVRHILMMEDFIIYMLTGSRVIDYSLAARSMAFDIRRLCWSPEIFSAAGIDSGLFSTPVPNGTRAGCLRKEVARELGLSEDVIVVPTGHDQVAAAIGAGVFANGEAVDGAGTVECITPVYGNIPENDSFYQNNYVAVPYVKPGSYVTYAFSYTGGALISWYIANLAKEEKRLAKERGCSVYAVLEAGMEENPTGILVLPHFAGAATPYMDVGSKGAVVGLTLAHNVSHMYRAMMEGVCYEMRLNLDCVAAEGIRPQKLRAAGGGAASGVWMQMKADILNLPITALESAEAGSTGCAMTAGVAAGAFAGLEEAAAVMIRERQTYLPRPEMHRKYEEYYERYRKLYQAIRPLV